MEDELCFKLYLLEKKTTIWRDMDREAFKERGVHICPICYQDMEMRTKYEWQCRCSPGCVIGIV